MINITDSQDPDLEKIATALRLEGDITAKEVNDALVKFTDSVNAVKLGLSVDSTAADVIDAYLKTQRVARVEDQIPNLTDFRIEKKITIENYAYDREYSRVPEPETLNPGPLYTIEEVRAALLDEPLNLLSSIGVKKDVAMALFLRSIKTDFPSIRLGDFIDYDATLDRFPRKPRTGLEDEIYGRKYVVQNFLPKPTDRDYDPLGDKRALYRNELAVEEDLKLINPIIENDINTIRPRIELNLTTFERELRQRVSYDFPEDFPVYHRPEHRAGFERGEWGDATLIPLPEGDLPLQDKVPGFPFDVIDVNGLEAFKARLRADLLGGEEKVEGKENLEDITIVNVPLPSEKSIIKTDEPTIVDGDEGSLSL